LLKISLAYVDPGLGALIWQAMVAAVVGFFFYLKKTRRWIVALFRKMLGREQAKVIRPGVPAETPAAKVEAKVETR
jgi:hypothetical protein